MKNLEKISIEEREKEIRKLEGIPYLYQYLQEWQMGFYSPNRVRITSGKVFDEYELNNFFKKIKPKFGNEHHIQIIKAQQYLNLVLSMPLKFRERYGSFLDEEDEKECRKKYNNPKFKKNQYPKNNKIP